MKRLIAILAACLIIGAVLGADTPERADPKPVANSKADAIAGDLSGVYSIRGKESKGPYSGVAIFEKHGEHYIVRYMVGATVTVGAGIHKGDMISVGWKSLVDSKDAPCGVTVYRVDGSRLVGRWAGLPSKGEVQDEELRLIDMLPQEE